MKKLESPMHVASCMLAAAVMAVVAMAVVETAGAHFPFFLTMLVSSSSMDHRLGAMERKPCAGMSKNTHACVTDRGPICTYAYVCMHIHYHACVSRMRCGQGSCGQGSGCYSRQAYPLSCSDQLYTVYYALLPPHGRVIHEDSRAQLKVQGAHKQDS